MAIRRQVRLRQEYIQSKTAEKKTRDLLDKKRKIRDAIQSGKTIPTELRDEELELRRDMELDDAKVEERMTADSEYAQAGVLDPKVFITTSRDPSQRLIQFAKELKLVWPNSEKVNRGNYPTKQLVAACREHDVTDLVIVHEHQGIPDGLVICHLPYGPTAYFGIFNAVLRHDVSERATVLQQYPHLIFENFSTTLGSRFKEILRFTFPPAKEDSKRVMTFANDNDYISFRHHSFNKSSEGRVELVEVGPRFELKPYQIRLGTVDEDFADNEWVLREYMNSARRKQNI